MALNWIARMGRIRSHAELKPRRGFVQSLLGSIATEIIRCRSATGVILLVASMSVFGGEAKADAARDLFASAPANSSQAVDHSVWDRLLKTYVKPGPDGINRVDYAAFKQTGQGELKLYISRLENVDPRELNRAEQFALLANLYNAKTIDIVLDHYPVNSIKDISLGGGLFTAFTGGPWKAKVTQLGGVPLSLDDIEHGILRPVFKDPRVHYAVNCASLGCPNIGTEAFTGEDINQQLDAAARAFIAHPRGVQVVGRTATLSSIYNWFKSDFGADDRAVVAHLTKYAPAPLSEKLRTASSLSYQSYDWSLNDARH